MHRTTPPGAVRAGAQPGRKHHSDAIAGPVATNSMRIHPVCDGLAAFAVAPHPG